MTVLRHRVLNGSQPVAGVSGTVRPWSGNKYAPRSAQALAQTAVSDAQGWLTWTIPTPGRRQLWEIARPGAASVITAVQPGASTVTSTDAQVGTLDTDRDLVDTRPVFDPTPDDDTEREQFVPSRLSATALKAGFLSTAVQSQTVALLGDSITDQNFQASPPAYPTNGYWNWAAVILRQRLTLTGVFGYPGQRISVIASHVPEVLASNPGTVIVLAGTNDVPANATLAQMQDDMTALLIALRAGGVRIVIGAIPPRGSYTGGQMSVLFAYNRWLASYANTIGAVFVHWTSALTDPATGAAFTNMLAVDGVHPAALGSARMGARLAAVLAPLIPATDVLSAGGDPTNLLPNGAMNGNASGISTNWIVKDLAGNTNNPATVTPTKVARTDDVPGQWQQLVVATTPGVSLWSPAATGYVPGDVIYALAEWERNNDWSSMGTANRTLRLNLRAQAGAVTNSYGMNHPAGTYFPVEAMPMSGVLRTPPLTVQAATTKIDMAIEFSGLGTLRIGRCEIRKL